MGRTTTKTAAAGRDENSTAPRRVARTTRVSRGDPSIPQALRPRKDPGQERSKATVEAIVRAAAELFAGRGYAKTNTNDIAGRAGVSVGSLYQYFPNKDAILASLLEQHLEAIDAVVSASLDEMADSRVPLRTAVRHLLERLAAQHDDDPHLTQAIEHQASQLPRAGATMRARERRHLATLETILRGRPDVRRGDPRMMADLLFRIAETTTAWLAHGGSRTFGRAAALDEATKAICAYVEP